MNLFKDDDKNTYYLKEIPSFVKQNDYIQKEYNNQTGFLGRKLIENPWLSDNAKLNLIETAKPQYKKEIHFIKSSLPYIKKGQNIHNKYLSSNNKEVKDQHELYLNNLGGRRRRKTRKNKTFKKKTRKSKTLKKKTRKRNLY
jgi:hypothetical protein